MTLSTADTNAKLLDHLKSCFKRTINRSKYESKATIQAKNQYLDYLINSSFQGVNRIFVLSFEDNSHQISYSRYFLPTVEMQDYIVMI